MKTRRDKKHESMIAAVLTITCIVSFMFILSSCSRSDIPEKTDSKAKFRQSGPLMEQGDVNVSLTDELGADANDPKSLAILGDRYFEGGRYVEAVDIYKKVLSLDPNDIDTYNDLGLAYQYLKQPDKAIETLRKGIEVMPTFQRIWISLGFVSISAGKTEDAKTALAKAVELGPDTPVGIEAKRMLSQLK